MIPLFAILISLALATTPAVAQNAREAGFAKLRILDRTSGELLDVDLPQGRSMEIGGLDVSLRSCRYRDGNISGNGFAYLDVTDTKADVVVFSGWMMSSAPALNPLEHPRYDVWLVRCKN